MKIAVIGSQCTGKSTFIKDFIAHWGMYTLSERPRYTDLVKTKKHSLNEDGNEASQTIIRDSIVDQTMYTSKDSNTIFDRSVLDNLVYTMWLNAKGKVSDKFVKETMAIAKEALVFYDILFFLPITKHSPIPFEPSDNRSNSEQYRSEIDNIFKALIHQYNQGNKTYFPFDAKGGCPAIIEIFGNREQRIELAKMYLQDDGNVYTEKDSLLLPTDPKLTDFK